MADSQSVVLDTHIWIWLANGEPAIEEQAMKHIVQAARRGNVLVPAICIWEVAMLETKGRILLSKPVNQWIDEALTAPGLELAPLSAAVAIESCGLPGVIHADPADRLIIATARIEGALLITRDRRILDYASLGYLRAICG